MHTNAVLRSSPSYPPAPSLPPPGPHQDLLTQHAGVLRDSHFDEVVVSQLQRLPEHESLEVLAEIGRHELVGVKNVPAYIMGIINRYKRGGARPGH